jgi:adenine deaminase
VVDNLENFGVKQTYIKGELVAENGKSLLPKVAFSIPNYFDTDLKTAKDFAITVPTNITSSIDLAKIRVIEAFDGELITKTFITKPKVENNSLVADIEKDILKMAVVNRYQKGVKPALAFIKNFGLKKGAIASSVGHDSHNITAVGTNDEDLCKAINAVIASKGGISVACGDEIYHLPLPVAGIMSAEGGEKVAQDYIILDNEAKKLGSTLKAPFMSLSFMALLVIPALKLSDKGLFDGNAFQFVDLFVE